MPPKLSEHLEQLSAEALAVTLADAARLGGVDPRILTDEARRRVLAELDASDADPEQVRSWLSALPYGAEQPVLVAWPADRTAARMSYDTFVARFDDLWYPAMDDVVVFSGDPGGPVLMLDHEETFVCVRPL